MFKCDRENLRISFNEFHSFEDKDRPRYGEFCLLELKDGGYTAGSWSPNDCEKSKTGSFIRGTGDSVSSEEAAKWHSLERYDLTESLEKEGINWINLGVEEDEAVYSVQFEGFNLLEKGSLPACEQYCLLIMKDGSLASGRWDPLDDEDIGSFIYAPALASYGFEEVWAWTPLSPDDTFLMEQEREEEIRKEEEMNRNPSVDEKKLKYGTDIEAYYDKALEKLRKEYPWATKTQMKKCQVWEIVPLHGQYVFGQTERGWRGEKLVHEWTEGETADEFIDFLCEYTKGAVERSNPEAKFRYGTDINVYLEKAYDKVKKDYRWFDKKMLKDSAVYDIREVQGEKEFVCTYPCRSDYSVCDHGSAEEFIERIVNDYRRAALNADPVVDRYEVSFGHVEIHGWNLERYTFFKLKTGDYKVSVTAGDRVTGGSRDFFITPDCFEAKTYEEFLDRYLEIVPGYSFGLDKKDLLPDMKLKKFLGY